jgi:hypothetical protein
MKLTGKTVIRTPTVHIMCLDRMNTSCNIPSKYLGSRKITMYFEKVTCKKCIANIIAEKLLKG